MTRRTLITLPGLWPWFFLLVLNSQLDSRYPYFLYFVLSGGGRVNVPARRSHFGGQYRKYSSFVQLDLRKIMIMMMNFPLFLRVSIQACPTEHLRTTWYMIPVLRDMLRWTHEPA
jgi:hypothetical protein